MAQERLSNILNHIRTPSGLTAMQVPTFFPAAQIHLLTKIQNSISKNPDDIVITYAARTPLTKAGKGGLKDTPIDALLLQLFKHTLSGSNIDPAIVEDICCGNVNDGFAPYKARAAALAAGFPNTTAVSSANRFCSSGLLAVQQIANQIACGSIEVGLAVGAEMMSLSGKDAPQFSDGVMAASQEAQDCCQPMGQTSENVGKDFGITREMQDRYAAESFKRAENAQKSGWFDNEIVPITTTVKNPKTGETVEVTVTKDDGIRYGTTFESLSKVRPAFTQWGDRSTGGNSSQVTDGAASVLLMKRSTAERIGQTIMAKFCGATVQGVAPRIMGIGPSVAIPKLLGKFKLSKDDVDLFEINEAFASMAVYCVRELGLDVEKVNPRGGAIALGHPLGATGARQIVTGLAEARRQKKKILVTSMCIGTGQGMAGLFVNEQV